jgi:hypothetical protein
MEDTFEIGWMDARGNYRYITKRGIQDVSEFVRNSEAYDRRIISIKNTTFQSE